MVSGGGVSPNASGATAAEVSAENATEKAVRVSTSDTRHFECSIALRFVYIRGSDGLLRLVSGQLLSRSLDIQ